jgi:hypothetical protein
MYEQPADYSSLRFSIRRGAEWVDALTPVTASSTFSDFAHLLSRAFRQRFSKRGNSISQRASRECVSSFSRLEDVSDVSRWTDFNIRAAEMELRRKVSDTGSASFGGERGLR